jgi:TPR repeat protein
MRSVLVFLLMLNVLIGGKIVDLGSKSKDNSANNNQISIEYVDNTLQTLFIIEYFRKMFGYEIWQPSYFFGFIDTYNTKLVLLRNLKLCRLNRYENCYKVGLSYLSNEKYYDAKKYFDKAANNKDNKIFADAYAALGAMYINGLGFLQDIDKGRGILEKGCDKGSGVSCYNLGMSFEQEFLLEFKISLETFEQKQNLEKMDTVNRALQGDTVDKQHTSKIIKSEEKNKILPAYCSLIDTRAKTKSVINLIHSLKKSCKLKFSRGCQAYRNIYNFKKFLGKRCRIR